MSFEINEILGLLIIYQSVVFILSLLFNKNAKPLFLKILMGICGVIILHFGYMLLQQYGYLDTVFLGPFFGLVYGPLYLAYTKSLIYRTLGFQKMSLHFIPSLVVLVLILAGSRLLSGSVALTGLVISLHFIGYLLLSLKHIYGYRKRLLNNVSSFYRISLFWLEGILYLQLGILGITLLESYIQAFMNTDIIILIIFGFTLILIHCFYYLGLQQVRQFKGFGEEHTEPSAVGEYNIPEEQFEEYLGQLTRFMDTEKPYLDYDITLQEISDKLGISNRNLSHVINRHFNKNYYAFINGYRLELAKNYLNTTDHSIKEIMYDSGFSNKATFYSLFKKDTGLTPVQYRKGKKM
ncbi:helix-turn-helix domain-containing protein [Robiginitalea sp. IMCC44478]|uniref:helix-turn-helix domain-containing protein n=1 Tax=Robiginitalea sp. IMCC44478 TaxID=3459122 RepID=UPI004042182C